MPTPRDKRPCDPILRAAMAYGRSIIVTKQKNVMPRSVADKRKRGPAKFLPAAAGLCGECYIFGKSCEEILSIDDC